MITGAHAILYSRDAERDRAFLRDVLGLPNVDAGHGWLIFGLPPSEIAVHPSDGDERHELYFLTEDIKAFTAAMAERGVACSAPRDMCSTIWGSSPSGRRPCASTSSSRATRTSH